LKAKNTIDDLVIRGDGEWSSWRGVEQQDLPDTHVVYVVVTD